MTFGVSVLVPSWNGRDHLAAGLPSLLAERDARGDVEILVLDNGSDDGSREMLARRFPDVGVVRSERNLGFAAGANLLAERANSDRLLFVNNDTRVEAGWIERMVAALDAASPDVGAVAGRLVDWEGEHLDFGRGVMTFDGHALALDQGRRLVDARVPRTGDELLFGCGGNLLVRREVFRALGGFDPEYFAYFEDVDFGWRLWAAGHRIVACAEGVVRHRLSATSSRLGQRRRGLLYERNALWTLCKNAEGGARDPLVAAALLTYLSRLSAMVQEETPLGIPGVGSDPGATRQFPRETMRARWTRRGPVELARRGAGRALRALADRVAPRSAALQLASDRTAAQLGALAEWFGSLPGLTERRRVAQAMRRRSDREIFDRFPLWIVPTYPGDAELFESPWFGELLPAQMRFEHAPLAAVVANPGEAKPPA